MRFIYFLQAMSFSEYYFSRYPSLPAFFKDVPENNLGIIVVVPCYNDDFVFRTLSSLENTESSEWAIEVIVVVNSGENTAEEIVAKNKTIFEKLKKQRETAYYKRFKLLPIYIENVPRKTAGVGNARKIGMDEAINRFSLINNPTGIIASLDADCLVDKSYFKKIEICVKENPKKEGFVFQFQHDFDAKQYFENEIEACRLYEMYLRYYKLALAISGFPHCFHTIGSCFAVTASAYTKIGGMSRRQGGEDFYFLHKLAQMTIVDEISELLVFPSPRISERVPFGTGPTVKNIIRTGDYHVYNFELFLVLKRFFDCFETLSKAENIELNAIPEEIINFAGKEDLLKLFSECKHNAKPGNNLKKRLFSKFDAFFVVKFLNSFNNDSHYPLIKVQDAVTFLLDYYSQNPQLELSASQKKDIELLILEGSKFQSFNGSQ